MSDGRPAGVLLDPARSLAGLQGQLGGELDPEARGVTVDRVVAADASSSPSDLVPVTSLRAVSHAQKAMGVLVCTPEIARRLPPARRWIHSHVWWVISRLVSENATVAGRGTWVHPEAVVDPTAELAIGSVVHAGATIGPRSRIGEYAVIYSNVRIGAEVTIGAHAVIGRPGFGWTTGPGGERVRIPQLGGVVIEDGVEVGPLSTVDAGTLGATVIGNGAKLDAHVHVGHNVRIGERVMAAAQVGFAGSSRLGDDVLVGGQAGFADHVHVGQGARVAAKSGVIGDVPAGAVVAGFPAVPRIQWLRSMASLLRRR